MSIKLKGLTAEEPQVKKQISLKQSDFDKFESYIEYLKEKTGSEYPQIEIASLMVVNWMAKDTDFNKWLKRNKSQLGKKEATATTDNKPSSEGSVPDQGFGLEQDDSWG